MRWLISRQRKKNQKLCDHCQLRRHRRPDLQPNHDQHQHHGKPLPSRSAQPFQSVCEGKDALRRQALHGGRFGPGAKAGDSKESCKKDFDQESLSSHGTSSQIELGCPGRSLMPAGVLGAYGSLFEDSDSAWVAVFDLAAFTHKHRSRAMKRKHSLCIRPEPLPVWIED